LREQRFRLLPPAQCRQQSSGYVLQKAQFLPLEAFLVKE